MDSFGGAAASNLPKFSCIRLAKSLSCADTSSLLLQASSLSSKTWENCKMLSLQKFTLTKGAVEGENVQAKVRGVWERGVVIRHELLDDARFSELEHPLSHCHLVTFHAT